MQETLGQPQWDLTYEPTPLAWEARLFLFYLLLACGFLFLRSASVVRTLWRTRKPDASDGSPRAETKSLKDLQLCSTKVASLKRAAVLTFILSFLALLDGSIRVLMAISTEKTIGLVALAGSASEILVMFALGISVCAALYTAFSVFEGILSRREAKRD